HRDGLRPCQMLGVLLDAGVQEANLRRRLDDALAFDLQDHPQNPVRAGVVRADAEGHAVALAADLQLLDVQLVLSRTHDARHFSPHLPRPTGGGPWNPGRRRAASARGPSCAPQPVPWPSPARRAADNPCAADGPPSRRAAESASDSDGPRNGCRTGPTLPAPPGWPSATSR